MKFLDIFCGKGGAAAEGLLVLRHFSASAWFDVAKGDRKCYRKESVTEKVV